MESMDYKAHRAIVMGRCLVETRNTFKQIAKEFGVSSTTVRRMLREVLPDVNPELAEQCNTIIEYHKRIAYLRGGEANKVRIKKLKRAASSR